LHMILTKSRVKA
jgi:N-acetyltransferase 10